MGFSNALVLLAALFAAAGVGVGSRARTDRGAMVGALLPTPLVNKTSRKRALLIAHAALVPGTLLLSIAWFPLMVFLSFLQGVFVGCLSTLAPLLRILPLSYPLLVY